MKSCSCENKYLYTANGKNYETFKHHLKRTFCKPWIMSHPTMKVILVIMGYFVYWLVGVQLFTKSMCVGHKRKLENYSRYAMYNAFNFLYSIFIWNIKTNLIRTLEKT